MPSWMNLSLVDRGGARVLLGRGQGGSRPAHKTCLSLVVALPLRSLTHWAGHTTSLSLSFPTFKMRITMTS